MTDALRGKQPFTRQPVFQEAQSPAQNRGLEPSSTIEMPLRTEAVGRIDPSRAASLSEEIAEELAGAIDHKLPPGIFRERFVVEAGAAFKCKSPRLGVMVTKP